MDLELVLERWANREREYVIQELTKRLVDMCGQDAAEAVVMDAWDKARKWSSQQLEGGAK